jgi:hypothetical protein
MQRIFYLYKVIFSFYNTSYSKQTKDVTWCPVDKILRLKMLFH